MQVEDAGGSEGQSVIGWIGVQALPRLERGLTSCRCHRTRRLSKPLTRGMFTMSNRVLPAIPALADWQGEVPAQSYRHGLMTAPFRGRM